MSEKLIKMMGRYHWVGKRAPNLITFGRLALVPVFVILLMEPSPVKNMYATVIFIIASLSDWLDGYLARVFKAESILGKMLDPLADKVLVMSALVMLCCIPSEPRVSGWMVVVLLARDMIITGLRSLAALKGVVVPASRLAKHKTAWTMLAIIGLLIAQKISVMGIIIDFLVIGNILLWLALLLSVISGILYFIELRNLFND
ncbi:MAG: CDP-diacylglycerol--glycerol-3-phosphate 3-phosphatidyltransferase [Deltaproteobacteria bacterium]|nr:CDP-diacylglycerol--glycerol-3-phosphate 3-phosphatidyltransferase [Deltaproteobacteria bacterium]